jgi:hypothetical protein
MTAQQLLDKLVALRLEGHDLSQIEVNYRRNYDSDAVDIADLEEGYYDEHTNTTLETINLITHR